MKAPITFKRNLSPDGIYYYVYMEAFKMLKFFRGENLIERVENVTTVNDLTECTQRWERWIDELKTPLPVRSGVEDRFDLIIAG